MQLTYDATVDAFQFELAPGTPVAKTIEWGHGVYVDVDARGRVLGIEVLDASTRFDAVSGLSAATLRVLLNSGRLVGRKQGRDWTVTLSDLYTYLESRAPSGRPAKSRKARRKIRATGGLKQSVKRRVTRTPQP